MAHDLLGVMSEWKPDVVVRETSELGACIAAERLRIPSAVVEVVATGLGDERRSLLAAGLATALDDNGLPPDPGLSILERQAVLSPFPPSYRGTPVRITESPWLSIRPTPFDESDNEQDQKGIQNLPPRPTVYLTLRTSTFNRRPEIFRAFIDGLADQPLNLIIAVGHNNDPAAFHPILPNVRVERYIPQSRVSRVVIWSSITPVRGPSWPPWHTGCPSCSFPLPPTSPKTPAAALNSASPTF
jgi:hypothetical protein